MLIWYYGAIVLTFIILVVWAIVVAIKFREEAENLESFILMEIDLLVSLSPFSSLFLLSLSPFSFFFLLSLSPFSVFHLFSPPLSFSRNLSVNEFL